MQLLADQPVTVKPGQKIDVEVRLDRSVHLRLNDNYLAYKTIPKRAYKPDLVAHPTRGKAP